jgi:hypothetical protein
MIIIESNPFKCLLIAGNVPVHQAQLIGHLPLVGFEIFRSGRLQKMIPEK